MKIKFFELESENKPSIFDAESKFFIKPMAAMLLGYRTAFKQEGDNIKEQNIDKNFKLGFVSR